MFSSSLISPRSLRVVASLVRFMLREKVSEISRKSFLEISTKSIWKKFQLHSTSVDATAPEDCEVIRVMRETIDVTILLAKAFVRLRSTFLSCEIFKNGDFHWENYFSDLLLLCFPEDFETMKSIVLDPMNANQDFPGIHIKPENRKSTSKFSIFEQIQKNILRNSLHKSSRRKYSLASQNPPKISSQISQSSFSSQCSTYARSMKTLFMRITIAGKFLELHTTARWKSSFSYWPK